VSALLDALSTFVGAGGLSGGIAAVASLGAKLYEKRLDQSQERARWMYETDLHERNAAHELHLAKQKLLISRERTAGETLASAIGADGRESVAVMRVPGMPWWVGAIRTLTRPILTYALVVLVALLWWTTEDESVETLIVAAVLALASASFSFWFGGRVVKSHGD